METTNQEWTVERVKELLPKIKCRLGSGKVINGKITGTQLQFARVCFYLEETLLDSEVSWETLVRCLNQNVPIQL